MCTAIVIGGISEVSDEGGEGEGKEGGGRMGIGVGGWGKVEGGGLR